MAFSVNKINLRNQFHKPSSDQGRNAETVFSINSLLSKPLNPWTETKPDWLEYDCVAAQGLDQQTNFCLSSDYNHQEVISPFGKNARAVKLNDCKDIQNILSIPISNNVRHKYYF